MLLATVVACTPKSEPKSVKGDILDATMNTIMIVADADTLSFGTMDAEKISSNGILIGDLAEVFYQGELDKTTPGAVCEATKVVVTPNPIAGSWVEPIPGIEGMQGIKMEQGGIASSINMATLVYNGWATSGNKLMLTGESIGNGQTIEFSEMWTIDSLSADSLIITSDINAVTLRYAREK